MAIMYLLCFTRQSRFPFMYIQTPLTRAAADRNLDEVKELIASGEDFNPHMVNDFCIYRTRALS